MIILGTVSGLVVVLIPLTEWIPHYIFGRRSTFIQKNKRKTINIHAIDKCCRTYLMLPVVATTALLSGMFIILDNSNILDSNFTLKTLLWFVAKFPVAIFIYLTWAKKCDKVEKAYLNIFSYLLYILLLLWLIMRCMSSGTSRFGQIQASFQDGSSPINVGIISLIVAMLIMVLFYLKLWFTNKNEMPSFKDKNERSNLIKSVIVGSIGFAVMVYIIVHNFDILLNQEAIFNNTVSIVPSITPLIIFIVLFSLVIVIDDRINAEPKQKNGLFIYKTTMAIFMLFVFDWIVTTGVKLAAQLQVIHNEVSRIFSNELPMKWCEDIGIKCGSGSIFDLNSMLINVVYWVMISEVCITVMNKLSFTGVGASLTLSLQFGYNLFVLTCTAMMFMSYDVATVDFFIAAVVEIVVVLVLQLNLLEETFIRVPCIQKLIQKWDMKKNTKSNDVHQNAVDNIKRIVVHVISAKYSIFAYIISRLLLVMIIVFSNSEKENISSFLSVVAVKYPFRKISCYLFQVALGVVAHNAVLAWYSQKLRVLRNRLPTNSKQFAKTLRKFRASIGLRFILSTFSKSSNKLLFMSYTLSNHINIVDKDLTLYLCTFTIFGLSHFFLAYPAEYHYQQSKLSNHSGSIYKSTYFRDLFPNNWDVNNSIGRNWSQAGYQCLCRTE